MEKIFSGTSMRSAPTMAAYNAYSAIVRREFYDGDLESASGDFRDVEMEKALSSPLSITRITTRDEVTFRRRPHHVRKNHVGLRVLWIVNSGSVKIVRGSGTTEILAGQAGLLDSNVPFTASLKSSPEANHFSYQILIPPDIFSSHLQEADRFSDPFPLESIDGEMVRELFDVIVKHGSTLGNDIAENLSHALLEAVAKLLRNSDINMPKRQTLVDRRLSDIESFILKNLSDPELSYDKVAISCGISPRYLCFLLKAVNTSFSELVWSNRLPKARDWLISPKTRDYPIHEIAYMSGFKSAAHFSRMFKANYGMPPREYRAKHFQKMDKAMTLSGNQDHDHREMIPEAA
ncbi:MAG: AraC family transcriptional regulator [Parasphingorhabdus sp.]|nr:AraC family transcriptional regulator [Parasphingorhabdus sp.]